MDSNLENICTCNNCGNLLIDTNPQVDAEKFDLTGIYAQELVGHECPVCETDGYLMDLNSKETPLQTAKALWEQLGNIPINEDEELDEDFMDFEKGTDRYEVWHWFEDKFDISIAKDLMGLK